MPGMREAESAAILIHCWKHFHLLALQLASFSFHPLVLNAFSLFPFTLRHKFIAENAKLCNLYFHLFLREGSAFNEWHFEINEVKGEGEKQSEIEKHNNMSEKNSQFNLNALS